MTRILSQSGNVIAADFSPRTSIEFEIKTELLYSDDLVCIVRSTLLMDGKPLSAPTHIMADVATGKILTS